MRLRAGNMNDTSNNYIIYKRKNITFEDILQAGEQSTIIAKDDSSTKEENP